MVELSKILKKYIDFSIEIDTLNIEENSLICVLGSNGSGKTTLFKIISNMTPFKGQIFIDDIDVKKSSRWKKLVATFLGEEYLLNFLKKDEYLDFYCSTYGVNFYDNQNANDFLKELYNSIPKEKLIREYSKGNKSKIGILAVLLSNAKYMIFDEPFANLDIKTQKNLSHYLNEMKRDKTIILSTHHKEIISNHCDRIIHIENGKITF